MIQNLIANKKVFFYVEEREKACQENTKNCRILFMSYFTNKLLILYILF